jgi:putative transposase
MSHHTAPGREQADRQRQAVLRIMQVNGLTLERHTGERAGRTHEGVVVPLRSNVRWCSDHLELHCRDGSIVERDHSALASRLDLSPPS